MTVYEIVHFVPGVLYSCMTKKHVSELHAIKYFISYSQTEYNGVFVLGGREVQNLNPNAD